MSLDDVQSAAAQQFGRQSHRYGKGHILADVSDVKAGLKEIALPPGSTVLDVATGAGHTGLLLAELGHRVTCADIATEMLERVREEAQSRSLKISTQQHPAEAFPHPNDSFDLVTCRVAAHHFSSPESFISETARVLRPDGHLLLIDGSAEDNQPVAEEWTHQVEKLRDPSHHRFITPGRWKELCEANGLSVVHTRMEPFKMPDLEWYFETANTPVENRVKVLELVRNAPPEARLQFQIGEEDSKIVWWWRRLTLIARRR